jgi:hypothetical protein
MNILKIKRRITVNNVMNNKHKIGLIFQYIKRKGEIVGVLVGVRCKNKISVSWSLCNKKDAFNGSVAFALCYRRLFNWSEKVPQSIQKDIAKFQKRCVSYFGKDSKNWITAQSLNSSDLSLPNYFRCIPDEIVEKWNLSCRYMHLFLVGLKNEEKPAKIGGILYATEMESIVLPKESVVFFGNTFDLGDQEFLMRGPDLLFRNTAMKKPSKGKYIKLTWSIEGDE